MIPQSTVYGGLRHSLYLNIVTFLAHHHHGLCCSYSITDPTISFETEFIVEALDDANVGNIYHDVDTNSEYEHDTEPKLCLPRTFLHPGFGKRLGCHLSRQV